MPSTAFAPLTSEPLPLAPLPPSGSSSSNSVPLISSNPAPIPANHSTSVPAKSNSGPVGESPTIFYGLENDSDVYELDLDFSTFLQLESLISEDLKLPPNTHFERIRKRPNIIIRNDKDIARLKNGDVLQIEL